MVSLSAGLAPGAAMLLGAGLSQLQATGFNYSSLGCFLGFFCVCVWFGLFFFTLF